MKIHEYNQMMAYLTRPGMKTGGQVIGKAGGLVEPGVIMYGRKAFTSPGYEKLKEWIANQPEGTALTVDDLKKVAKENNWTDLPENLDQRMRAAYEFKKSPSHTSPESDFWKAQRTRLNFQTAWSAEAIERHKAGSRKAAQLSSQIQKTAYDIPRSNLDEFVKSWITNNLKNYTPGEFDKFRVDMKNAVLMETGEDVAREARFGRTKYKVEHPSLAAPKKVTYFEKTTPVEEIKNLLKEGTPPNEITRKLGVKNSTILRVAQASDIPMPSGKQFSPILNDFPNIRSTAAGGAKPFEIFGITQKSDTARHLPMTFNKIFYKGQLELNPTLKQELIDYIDYVNKDKTGTGGRAVGTAHANAAEHNRYYTKGVKEILNGLAPQQKKPVIGSVVGDKKWDTFSNKTRGNFSTGYPQKIKYLEELAGYEPGSHSKQIRTLRESVNKMFGLTEMTKELRFKEGTRGIKKVAGWLPSYDHLVNISFAVQSKDPVIARTALDNISIVPAHDNLFVKGFGYDGDKLFNSKVYEYENALRGEKLSKLDDLKTFSKDMGIKIKVEGGKVIPSPIEDLAKKPLPAKMESYVSDLLKKNPNIASHPDFQLLPKDFREMITKYKGGDPDFLGKFKTKLNELDVSLREIGIKPTDTQKTILKKINDAPIPNRAKALLLPIVAGAAAITGADLMTSNLQAAEPGQMPQGSPGQLSEDEEGLSFGEKAAIGAGGAYALRKPAWKYALKPALKVLGSPAAGLGFAGWSFVDHFNASKAETPEGKVYDALTTGIKFGEGENEKEILGSQSGMELLFPEVVKQGAKKLGVEFSKKGAQNAFAALGRFAMNPIGKAARIMTPTGLALNAAAVAKRYYDFAKDEMGRLEQMKPEEREAYNEMLMDETYSADAGDYYTSEDVLAGKPVGYNQGGRVGFAKGPKDPTRRLVLKGLGALAVLPIVGRFFKAGKLLKTGAYTGPVIEKIQGMPEWLPSLVKRLWNEGEDVTKTAATMERQVVKRGTLEGGDDVDLIYDVGTGDVRIDVTPGKGKYETSSGAFNKEYELYYKKGETITEGKHAGKKTPDEFDVSEIEGSADPHAMDVNWEGRITTVDDALTDLTELEAFAKKQSTKKIHKKKGTTKKDVFPDYDYSPDDYDID